MKAQQVIYTSCRQGIDGSNSGFQNYSYSPRMKQWLDNGNAIGSMQSYQPPRDESLPILPSKEEAQSLYPHAQYFGIIDGPDNLYGLSMNSYIGRDYPEGSVRGGNFVSHVLALPASDVDTYPCAFINSNSFLRWIDAETVRNPERPQPLDEINLQPNASGHTLDDICEFLDDDSHAEMYARMLTCLLTRTEGGYPKKIIINDSEENFILWVSALEYALTVRQSLDWSFSFYEYNPANASADVIRATDFMQCNLHDSLLSAHFIFDPSKEEMPQLDNISEDLDNFVDFVVTTLRYKVTENLISFRDFLNKISFKHVDSSVATAYTLYSIINKATYINELDANHMAQVCDILKKYACESQSVAFFTVAVDCMSQCRLKDGTLNTLVTALANVVETTPSLNDAPETLLNILIEKFTQVGTEQAIYEQIHALAAQIFKAPRNVDAELFRSIAQLQSAKLQLTNNPKPSWNAYAYASMTAAALCANKPTNIPKGVLGSAMLSCFDNITTSTTKKVITTLVNATNATQSVELYQHIIRSLHADLDLSIMFDLLILEQDDRNRELSKATTNHLLNAYLQTDNIRVACLQSLVDINADIACNFITQLSQYEQTNVLEYANWLANTCNQLPAAFVKEYGQYFAQTTWELPHEDLVTSKKLLQILANIPGVSDEWSITALEQITQQLSIIQTQIPTDILNWMLKIFTYFKVETPTKLILLAHLKLVEQACNEAHKNPLSAELRTMCKQIQLQSRTLPLNQTTPQFNQYLSMISQNVASVIFINEYCADLQSYAVPQHLKSCLVSCVLKLIVEDENFENSLLLLAIDASLINKENLFSTQQLAGFFAKHLISKKVKSSHVVKFCQNSAHMKKIMQRYTKLQKGSFPAKTFDEIMSKIVQNLEKYEKENPTFFTSVKNFFGNNKQK